MMKSVVLFLSVFAVGLFLLNACVPTYPITDSAADPALIYFEAGSSQATAIAAAATAQYFTGQLTATSDAEQAVATTRAWKTTATQQAALLTATERTWSATATADSLQATQAAEISATAQALAFEATQQALHATATNMAVAAQAQATALWGESESVRLGVEREQMMNQVKATAPFLALALLLGVMLVAAWYRLNVMLVARDARGDAKLMVILNKQLVYDPDRNPAPVLAYHTKNPTLPIPADLATTARDQMLDLISRGLPGQGAIPWQKKTLLDKMVPRAPLPATVLQPIQVIPPTQAHPLLRDVIPGIMRDALEGDLNHPEALDE